MKSAKKKLKAAQIGPLTGARIGVLMGGQSAEREVSLRTGQAVHQALLRRGYDAMAIDVDRSIVEQLRDHKIEMVFVALHGPGGEDGSMQGLLETLGIPYTGSGVRASAIAMHKAVTKTLLAASGIPVARNRRACPGQSSQGDSTSASIAGRRETGGARIDDRYHNRAGPVRMGRGSASSAQA